jgi:two-component sensor histidine kinase
MRSVNLPDTFRALVNFGRSATLLLLCCANLGAQQPALDSLDILLSQKPSEGRKMELLWTALDKALDDNLDRAVEYAQALRQMEQIIADSSLWMEALRKEAYADRYLCNYLKTNQSCKMCHEYFSRHGDTLQLAKVANQLGSMHLSMGYNVSAQNYLLEVYNLYQAKGNPAQMAYAINGPAIFYSNTRQSQKAMVRYEEALALYEVAGDTLGLANVHANLGLALIKEGKYDDAEYHLNQQGHLDSLMNSNWGLGFYFDFMGYLRQKQDRLQEAYQFHLTSLEVRQREQSQYNITESRTNLATVLFKMDRYPEAIAQAELILAFKDQNQSLSHQQTAYSVLANAKEAQGNYKEALQHQRSYQLISDSIFNRDILETVAEKDAKFELATQKSKIKVLNTEKRAAHERNAQKNRTITIFVISLIVFLLLSLILFWITRKYLGQRAILAKALSDKDFLLMEIHHRVKNNLQMVSSLLSLQSRTIDDKLALEAINEGKNRVHSMALIYQDLYQSDNLTGVNVKQYLIKLCAQLFNTYNVDDERVKLKLSIEDVEIDVDTLVPLGLIINKLVTNTLKYAFPENKGGTLSINFGESNGKLRLEVNDDGTGFDPRLVSKESFGQRMMASLTKQLKGEMKMSTDQGTRMLLELTHYQIKR